MTPASRPAGAGAGPRAPDRTERVQPWVAALTSALVHAGLIALALWMRPVTMSTPQGSMSGGHVIQVEFVDDAPEPATAIPSPPPTPVRARRPTPRPAEPRPTPAPPDPQPSGALQVQATPVDDPAPPDPVDPPTESPTPPAFRSTGRPGHVWGQPPGMPPPQPHASASAGPAPNRVPDRGRRNDPPSAQPTMEVDGYQVLYELVSDTRLREWKAEGMTEIFIPLPGTRQLMACPLETALRRGSGPCRMVEPDDPELERIGDARKAISMHRVYRRGELMWRGPGAYR